MNSTINILLVEDNLGDAFLIRDILKPTSPETFKLTHVENLEQAIKCLREDSFDLILLDLSLPESQGLDTLLAIEEQAHTLPVVVLTGTNHEFLAIQAVQQGAQDYLLKDCLLKGKVNRELLVRSIRYAMERSQLRKILRQSQEKLAKLNRELQARVEERTAELKQKNEELKSLLNLSRTDKLTGLANRYSWEELFEREWKNAVRNSKNLSVMMIDIDFFKLFNDFYGHQQGDDCLRQISQAIKKALKRPKDLVARYGGEEFLVILPDTAWSNSIVVAEQIRANVKDLNIAHAKSTVSEIVTISLGIASIIPRRNSQSEVLITAADKALYLAKHKGRNCIEVERL